jgi:hypothetical protein
MCKTYTPDDLIRFIYHETSESEELGIIEQLASDQEFLNEYRQLVKTVSALGGGFTDPHPTSVNIVLEYSASLHEKTVH